MTRPIVGGVIGAVLGYAVVLVLFSLINFGGSADPIKMGMLVLFVFSPAGAVGGLLLGTRLMQKPDAGGFASNAFKALGIVLLVAGIGGAMAYFYVEETATPWLNPNAATPELHYEIRLPANVALPASSQSIAVELRTDLNTMPGELAPGKFRRDGEQAVIVGQVDLAFRTWRRRLAVKIAGRPDRVYPIGLSDVAPHAPEFGPWEKNTDGSEIRYRARWPGR